MELNDCGWLTKQNCLNRRGAAPEALWPRLASVTGGLALEQAQVGIEPVVTFSCCCFVQRLHPGLQNLVSVCRESQVQALVETSGRGDLAGAQCMGLR